MKVQKLFNCLFYFLPLFISTITLFSVCQSDSELEQQYPESEAEEEGYSPENEDLSSLEPTENNAETNVSVFPTTRNTVQLPPAPIPPEGVLFENKSPNNVQAFKVPGVGLPIEESEQVAKTA